MPDQLPPPHAGAQRPLRKKWWFRFTLFFLLLLTATALSLPLAIRYGLRHWLLANGADQVEIGSVRVNPFTVAISLRDITIFREHTAVLDKARIDLNIGLSRIIRRQAYIQSIEFRHFNLDLEQDAEGRLRIASYLLPAYTDSPSDDATHASGTPWIFRADRVRFVNSLIHFTRPDLKLNLAIDQATLVRFTTAPGDKSGSFSFQGRLNDAPLALDLDTVRILPDLVLQGRIRAKSLRCSWLDRLLGPWLKPFAGRMDLDGRIGFASLSSDVMQVDYDGRLGLADSDVGGRTWKATARSLSWKGTVAFRDVPEQAMTVTTNGTLRTSSFRLELPVQRLVLQEPNLELRGRTTVTISDTVRVQSETFLAGKGVRLDLPPYGYSDKEFRWQGSTSYDSGDAGGLKVRTDGVLAVHGLAFTDQATELPLSAGSREIRWQGKIGFQDKKNASRLDLEGTLTGGGIMARFRDRLRMEQDSMRLAAHGSLELADQLALKGTGSLQAENFRIFPLPDGNNPLFTLGSLRIDNLSAPGGREISVPLLRAGDLQVALDSDLPMRVTVPEIRLEDIHTRDLATISARLLQVQAPRVRALLNDRGLVSLGSVELKDLEADTTGALAVHRLNFDDLRFLDRAEGGQPVCRVAGATLSAMHWSPDTGLNGDALGIDDLFCTLIRRKDGVLDVSRMLAAMRRKDTAPGKATVQAPPKNGSHRAVRLKSVIVRGRSGLHFEDYTLAVPFVSDLAIETLQVTTIDSGRPDEPAHVRLSGTMEERAPLEVTGTVKPFAEPLALAMKIKLKNYPLARLSAYTVQSVGTALAAGRLKLKSNLAIADGRLNMRNRVVLKNLQTKTISPQLARKLDNRLPVSLDAALSMLRDSKGVITLNVPIKGPLSDLDVGIDDILITALGKAIVPAASSYLVYALGPYAALAYVGIKVGEKILQVSLPPVDFAPGSAEIGIQQKKYLERIATLLKNRPATDLQLMPISTPRDLAPGTKAAPPLPPRGSEQEKALLHLGQQRAEALRDYLAATWSIDRNRLMISMTRISADTKKGPRVELQL